MPCIQCRRPLFVGDEVTMRVCAVCSWIAAFCNCHICVDWVRAHTAPTRPQVTLMPPEP